MTVKNIFHLSFLAVAVVTLNTACTFEQDEFFDETASLRIIHENQRLQERLVSESSDEKHGWVIQYFVAGTDDAKFEGFNLFGRFYDNWKVTLAGNHRFLRNGNANKYTEFTSSYEMLAEEGPVLSFCTWNDILTVFEDPVDPSAAPRTISPNGEGMKGDHNFVLKAFDENEILFRGERHTAEIRFIPCDRTWEEYIAATNEMKNQVATSTLPNYYVTNGTDTMYMTSLYKGVVTYGDRVYDPLVKKTLSCVFTPNGFRFNHPDSLVNNVFQEFTLTEDQTRLLSEDQQTQIIACWDTYIVDHTAVWKIDEESFTDVQAALFTQISAELKKYNANYSLESIGWGQSSGTNKVTGLVLTFYTNAAKSKTNTAGYAMTSSRPAFGQLLLKKPAVEDEEKIDKNMTTIGNKATGLLSLTRQFAATLDGKYNMTPDSYFLPKSALFTAIEGGSTFKTK